MYFQHRSHRLDTTHGGDTGNLSEVGFPMMFTLCSRCLVMELRVMHNDDMRCTHVSKCVFRHTIVYHYMRIIVSGGKAVLLGWDSRPCSIPPSRWAELQCRGIAIFRDPGSHMCLAP